MISVIIPPSRRRGLGTTASRSTRSRKGGPVGKPYAQELSQLAGTFAWAMAAPVGTLSRALRATVSLSQVAVGSGGSFTTAQFAAAVHRQYTSCLATAATPLQAAATPENLRTASVLLLTAGGRNPDVLGALRRLVEREPKRLVVMCTRVGSPLAALAAKYPWVDVAEFDLPVGKDGFLATNSLLASATLLVRSYVELIGAAMPLPRTLSSLLRGDPDRVYAKFDRLCRPLWARQHLIVLHGPETHAAAIDLESKLTEAALGAVQLADYRHFAHGRHHWLAKHGDHTGILAILTRADRELAERMLSLLPRGVPVVRLHAHGTGVIANLAALVQVMMVTGTAGSARGIDPGDPGVPSFGRKVYHMRVFGARTAVTRRLSGREQAAIERKSNASVDTLAFQGQLTRWRRHYRSFVKRLAGASFCGVVLDYDGTLCDDSERFGSLPHSMGAELNRLLRGKAVLGIATGRGKSVRKALRDVLDQQLWSRVVVGYYNGGDIGVLSDDAHPDGSESVDSSLRPLLDVLRGNPFVTASAKITARRPQITIEPNSHSHDDQLWAVLQHVLCRGSLTGIAVLRSSHSVDVTAPGVCKRAVVARLRELAGVQSTCPVLCIGDRGCWPGNDFSLLSEPYSLSVEEVSPEPESCWNLAAPGQRGARATIEILRRLRAKKGKLQLKLD